MYEEKLKEALLVPNTGIVVISMQDYFCSKFAVDGSLETLVNNQINVINKGLELNIPLIFANKLVPRKRDLVKGLKKYSTSENTLFRSDDYSSCFKDRTFESELDKRRIKHLFLMGVYAEFCVKETMLDGVDAGYEISSAANVILEKSHGIEDEVYRIQCRKYIE